MKWRDKNMEKIKIENMDQLVLLPVEKGNTVSMIVENTSNHSGKKQMERLKKYYSELG